MSAEPHGPLGVPSEPAFPHVFRARAGIKLAGLPESVEEEVLNATGMWSTTPPASLIDAIEDLKYAK